MSTMLDYLIRQHKKDPRNENKKIALGLHLWRTGQAIDKVTNIVTNMKAMAGVDLKEGVVGLLAFHGWKHGTMIPMNHVLLRIAGDGHLLPPSRGNPADDGKSR